LQASERGAFQIFAASTCVSPHPLKGSTVLEFDIPLQGIGAKAKIWNAPSEPHKYRTIQDARARE